MKILILADHFACGGGAGTIAKLHAEELTKNHTVSVLTAHLPKDFESPNLDVAVHNLDYSTKWRNYTGLKNKKALQLLKEYLSTHTFDLVLIHNLHVNWSYAALPIIEAASIPSVLVFHDVSVFTNYSKLTNITYTTKADGTRTFDYSYSLLKNLYQLKFAYPNPFRQRSIKKYLQSATKTVTVSHALKDALTAHEIRVDIVVHNGATTDYNPTVTYDGSILFVGRMNASKGTKQAIDCLAYLKEKHQFTPELRVAGDTGIGLQKLLSYAKKRGVENQVASLGWITGDTYTKELETCRLMIVPSISFDSFPTVVLEAMQYKKPVVATIFGGAKELVAHGKTGFVADPFDTATFSEHVRTLLTNKNKAKDFGEAGFKRVSAHFSLSQQTKKLLDVIKESV